MVDRCPTLALLHAASLCAAHATRSSSPRHTVVIAEPDFKSGELGPDAAFLLLASDGLFDVMGSGTAARLAHDLLLENRSAAVTAQFIVRYAAQQRNMLKPAGNGKNPMGE